MTQYWQILTKILPVLSSYRHLSSTTLLHICHQLAKIVWDTGKQCCIFVHIASGISARIQPAFQQEYVYTCSDIAWCSPIHLLIILPNIRHNTAEILVEIVAHIQWYPYRNCVNISTEIKSWIFSLKSFDRIYLGGASTPVLDEVSAAMAASILCRYRQNNTVTLDIWHQ